MHDQTRGGTYKGWREGVHDQDRPGGGPTRGGVRECMIRTGQRGDLQGVA